MIKKAKNFVVQSSKEVLGGEPVFKGTRVPVRTLLGYLKAGDRLDDFLKDFPTVSRAQAVEVLEWAEKDITRG